MVKDKAYLLAGNFFSRILPILFGLYLARSHGEGEYSSFVLLLNYGAALSAAATLGMTPRVLAVKPSDNADAQARGYLSAAILIMVACLAASAVYWLALSGSKLLPHSSLTKAEEALSVAGFCLGLVFVAFKYSSLCQKMSWRKAGLVNVLVYLAALLVSVLVTAAAHVQGGAVLVYCAVFFSVSVLFSARDIGALCKTVHKAGVMHVARNISKSMEASIFGICTLVGVYMIGSHVNATQSASVSAQYSLSYQLFSLTLFLPSMLGSVVIPRMVAAVSDQERNRIFRKGLASYFGLAMAMALFIVAVYPVLGWVFDIDTGYVSIVVLMQACAVISALNAMLNQFFIARKKFGPLSISSVLWLLLVLPVVVFGCENLNYILGSLVLAYACQAGLMLVYYQKTKRERFDD